MKRMLILAAVAGLVVVGAAFDAQAAPPATKNFGTHLSGDEEVPARLTAGTGQATFRLSRDGNRLFYRLIVDDIDNVVASHIHLGPFGVNGPVVAFLAGPFPPGGGPIEGIIGEGVITSANLVGPLAGQDLSVLIAAMRTGGTYVNVHTNDGIDPPNTGAGDFPGGEIRGQIRGHGSRGGPAPQGGN